MKDKRLNLRGWLTPLIDRVTTWFTSPSKMFFEPRTKSLERKSLKATAKRAKQVDTYVVAGLFVEVASYFAVVFLRTRCLLCTAVCGALTAVVIVKILEIPSTALRVALFDRVHLDRGVEHGVASRARMVVLGFVNYVELIACFAVIYAWAPEALGLSEPDWFAPFYLSAVSQLTIGYGELHPEGWLRPIACIQGLLALMLILLLIGRFITMLEQDVNLEDTTP